MWKNQSPFFQAKSEKFLVSKKYFDIKAVFTGFVQTAGQLPSGFAPTYKIVLNGQTEATKSDNLNCQELGSTDETITCKATITGGIAVGEYTVTVTAGDKSQDKSLKVEATTPEKVITITYVKDNQDVQEGASLPPTQTFDIKKLNKF